MKPGTLLQGKYRLISLLGEGGMGAVWRAEHLGLGAPVAVKLLHEREASSVTIRARFDAEAKTAASLRSPHVVQVFDFGIDEGSQTPFIVMELLEGESLSGRIERRGALPLAEVARVVSHVARALSRAHEVNVTHRDLKPANIFLVRNGDEEVAKVLDFGIAKRSMHASPQGSTATGTLLGTPHYMSPEQIRDSKAVDPRTDLWSLGVIAVECLTGQLPFDADNLPGLALRICQGQSTLPSRLGPVPAGFDAWFQRATALSPAERFASATQMAAELQALCGVPSESVPVSSDAASVAANLGRAEVGSGSGGATAPFEPGLASTVPDTPPPLAAELPPGAAARAGGRAAELARSGALASVAALSRTSPGTSAAPDGARVARPGRRWALAAAGVLSLGGAAYVVLAPPALDPAGAPFAAQPLPGPGGSDPAPGARPTERLAGAGAQPEPAAAPAAKVDTAEPVEQASSAADPGARPPAPAPGSDVAPRPQLGSSARARRKTKVAAVKPAPSAPSAAAAPERATPPARTPAASAPASVSGRDIP